MWGHEEPELRLKEGSEGPGALSEMEVLEMTVGFRLLSQNVVEGPRVLDPRSVAEMGVKGRLGCVRFKGKGWKTEF